MSDKTQNTMRSDLMIQGGRTNDAIESNDGSLPSHAAGIMDLLDMGLPVLDLPKGGSVELETIMKNSMACLEPPYSASDNQLQDIDNYASASIALSRELKQRWPLENAVDFLTSILPALRLHIDIATGQRNLGHIYLTLFWDVANPEYLTNAICAYEKAQEVHPKDFEDYHLILTAIGDAHLLRYQYYGENSEYEAAIDWFNQALDHTEGTPILRPRMLMNIGRASVLRYNRTGYKDDLDKAEKSFAKASDIYKDMQHINWTYCLCAQAGCIVERAHFTSDVSAISTAIIMQHRALKEASNSAAIRSGLSMAYFELYVISRYQAHGRLDTAAKHAREALALIPLDHPRRAFFITEVARCLLHLSRRRSGHDDLNTAAALIGEVEKSIGRYPARVLPIKTLYAEILFERKEYSHSLELLESLSKNEAISMKDRFSSATLWAERSREAENASGESLVDSGAAQTSQAYRTALAIMEEYLTVFHGVELQHQFLENPHARSLTPRAASYAISRGDYQLAVEILEQGKTAIWSLLNDYHHPLQALEDAGKKNLADQYMRISQRLEDLTTSPINRPFSGPSPLSVGAGNDRLLGIRMKEHSRLRNELEAILKEITAEEGFSEFLKAPTFDILKTAATEEGPIIMINIDTERSDALIITNNQPPQAIPLLGLSYELTMKMCNKFEEAIAVRGESSDEDRATRLSNRSDPFVEMVNVLWERLCEPIASYLDLTERTRNRRVWWYPTGAINGLPLHAAGPPSARSKGIYDICISSYATSLSSLIKARKTVVDLTEPRLLVVGDPKALRGVRIGAYITRKTLLTSTQVGLETDRIIAITNRLEIKRTILNNPSAQEVIEKMSDHTWIHFACHGMLDVARPFDSGFIIDKENQQYLRVLQIMKARLQRAELAFLSVCHSGSVTPAAPDAAVNLVKAIEFCGFKSIIGTLWTMQDGDGPSIAEDFYTALFENKAEDRNAAKALHQAVENMRKKNKGVRSWGTFAHFGI